MKRCTSCKTEKPVEAFGKDSRRRDGLNPCCRVCHNQNAKAFRLRHPERGAVARLNYQRTNRAAVRKANWHSYRRNRENRLLGHVKRRYKLNEAELLEVAQKRKDRICDACQRVSAKSLHVDHDHQTGKYRGMLCHNCNVIAGHAKDNARHLSVVASYLLNRLNR